MKKPKHDKELEKLAQKLMNMPYNKNGTDKSFVSEVLFKNWQYFSSIGKADDAAKNKSKNI